MNNALDWRLAEAVDALLDLPRVAREQRLAAIDTEDPDQARQLRAWLERIDASEGRLEAQGVPDGTQPWRAIVRVGRGGMGEVWRGERADGAYARTVAIKFLRPDRAAAAASILRERQLLARLRHPGIAALLDGGIAADGRPYLVTEWVAGERLDLWLQRTQPGLRERVAMTVAIAAAVAEAHSQLVIHRDLKPANVMVDETGAPRLLDFGIARALDDGQSVLLTDDRALTPAFAAPEQLRGEAISTRTDIYGLGGLLYLLLTGRGAHGDSATSLAQLVERVCQQDAPAPSRLAPAADADLDAITLCALARDPNQRYASVDALISDLQRWQRGEFVHARLPSRQERARRFAARHWLPLSLTGALMLALAGGMLATWRQRDLAEQARQIAVAERGVALTELAHSESLRDALVASFKDAPEGTSGSANDWLDRVAAQAQRMDAGPARARLLVELAELESERSQPVRATTMYQQALEQQSSLATPSLARAQCGLARALAAQGAGAAAFAAYQRGLARAQRLSGSQRLTLVYCLNSAIGSDGTAPSAQAIPALELALAELDALGAAPRVQSARASTLHSLGSAHELAGNTSDAIRHYEQALALDVALGQSESIGSATTLGAIAGLQVQSSRFAAADHSYSQALALSERVGGRTLVLATDLANHAGLKNTLGDYAGAAALATRALAVIDAVAPGDSATRGNASLELAKALERQGRVASAWSAATDAERAFAAAYGPDHDYVYFVAITRARIQAAQGEADAASQTIDATLTHFRERQSAGAIAACLSVATSLALARGDLPAADSAAQEMVEIQRQRGTPDHWRVAAAEAEWAEVAAAESDGTQVRELVNHALPILLATFGPDHWRSQRARELAERWQL